MSNIVVYSITVDNFCLLFYVKYYNIISFDFISFNNNIIK